MSAAKARFLHTYGYKSHDIMTESTSPVRVYGFLLRLVDGHECMYVGIVYYRVVSVTSMYVVYSRLICFFVHDAECPT